MTSKISFTKMVLQNVKERGAWLLVSFLAMLMALPVQTMMRLDNVAAYGLKPKELEKEAANVFLNVTGFDNIFLLLLVVVSAFCLGMTGYMYLYSKEKTDFYHSLPLKRERMYFVPYVSGILIFVLPYLLNLLLALLAGAVKGTFPEGAVSMAFGAFLNHIVFFLVFYHVAILAVMLTGNLFTGAMAYAAFLSYGFIIKEVFIGMAERFFQTVVPSMLQGGSVSIFRLSFHTGGWTFSPLYAYYRSISDAVGISDRNIPWLYMGIGAASAIVVLALCILVFRLRPSESYHKAIAFKKLEPFIKTAVVFPFSVLFALGISSGIGKHVFGWFVVILVFTAWVLSTAMDFLYRMDIRESLRPRISTGVVLGMLAVTTIIYRFDVLKADTYLPKEDKIESMSVYIEKMNGLYSYPYDSAYNRGSSQMKAYLDNTKFEKFQDIYSLAKMGVEVQKDNDGFLKLKDEESVLYYCVRYHLKSGRDVYRYYEIKQDDAAVSLMGKIYDSWEYKEQTLPVEFIDEEKITEISLKDIHTTNKQVTTSEEMMRKIFKTYKNEWESLSFEESTSQQVVGFLYVDSLTGDKNLKDSDSSVDYGSVQTQSLPLYEGFVNTRKLLEEAGCPVYTAEDVDKIEKVVLTSADEVGNEEDFTFTEPKDIKEILENSMFDQYSNPATDSYPNYSKSVRIYWKDDTGESKDRVYLGKDLPSCVKKVLKTED